MTNARRIISMIGLGAFWIVCWAAVNAMPAAAQMATASGEWLAECSPGGSSADEQCELIFQGSSAIGGIDVRIPARGTEGPVLLVGLHHRAYKARSCRVRVPGGASLATNKTMGGDCAFERGDVSLDDLIDQMKDGKVLIIRIAYTKGTMRVKEEGVREMEVPLSGFAAAADQAGY